MSVHTEFGMSGTGVWRQSAATGHHLAAPTGDGGEGEEWRGLSRTAGERNYYDNYACGAYSAREKKLSSKKALSIHRRARYTANLLAAAR